MEKEIYKMNLSEMVEAWGDGAIPDDETTEDDFEFQRWRALSEELAEIKRIISNQSL